jgi:hypothetical protein
MSKNLRQPNCPRASGGTDGPHRTSTYRYKRPPRRKKKAVALAVPAIVSIPRKQGRKVGVPTVETAAKIEPEAMKSSIVTVRRRGRRFADVPDVTPEEHRLVGDLADALWRDMARRITDKGRQLASGHHRRGTGGLGRAWLQLADGAIRQRNVCAARLVQLHLSQVGGTAQRGINSGKR